MIRSETFDVSRETFASARGKTVDDVEKNLLPHITDALNRLGLPSWEAAIVAAATDIFDTAARAEVDEWNHVLDDMRDAFGHELAEALKNTKATENKGAQAAAITRWVSTMALNAATEAATTSDTSAEVGLEWVTMHDGDVRSAHAAVNGQTVPTGHEFSVGGEKLLYPGQPVGDPANWINCRCAVRPAMIGELSVSRETLTASAAEEPITSAVIVALPADTDPITAASSETDGAHCTLLFFGDVTALDQQELTKALETFAAKGVGIMTENVSGSGVLGPNKADVVLIDGASLVNIREGLLQMEPIFTYHEAVEQFPTWIPHVTLGYPETPANGEFAGESVTFDRLALWFGEDRTAIYPLGETMPEKDAPDAVTAAVEDAVPAPAEAPAAPPAPDVAEPATTDGGSDLRPWHGVLAPEGAPSGDKRGFAAKMLTMRDLPLPLKAQFIDDEGHKGSMIVGRIDEVYRDGGLIKGAGVWDNTPEADRAFDMIDKKMWRGVSVDLDSAEGEMVEAADGETQPSIEFTQGRVCSATLCAIPAFAEAFIRNGTWDQFANEPLPSGAMVEIPDWPAADKTPALALVASAAPSISADYFRNPMLTEPTAVTRGEEGLIFGHLGIWDECHIAYEVCTTVPPSETDYAYFLTGQVFTDAGPVAVGQLTVGGGHADMKLGVRAAIAHYDNVASAVADITVGEDEHGVWFSGRIRPWATEQQIHEMFAAGPSGDWRGVRYRGSDSMELVAAHAVNVPGFPVTRPRFAMEGTRQMSLVAAGMVPREPAPAADDFDSKMDAYFARKERAAKAAQFKSNIRTARVADLKKKLITRKGK